MRSENWWPMKKTREGGNRGNVKKKAGCSKAMKHAWLIEPSDIAKVKAFLKPRRDDLFVRQRVARNLRDNKPSVGKADVWLQIVACLLTTQQRSGPKSAVTRFIKTQPFPLSYETCLGHPDAGEFAKAVLTSFGGLRRTTIIAGQLAGNLRLLEEGLWQRTLDALDTLRTNQTVGAEREVADFIDLNLDGFGPKQARNLLQCLGLSRHEIPIDSRITKWLNDFGFPVQLSPNALGHPNYYEFVMEGFQALCQECGVPPCILDAAIFASFDGSGWTEENIVW